MIISDFKSNLCFPNPSDEQSYQEYVSSLSKKLYKYFFLYVLMALITAFFRNIYFNNYFSLWKLLFLSIFLLFIYLFIRKDNILIKKHIELLFCFVIIFLYVIHIKIFFPFILNQFEGHYAFYLGSGIETLRIFLYLSKMRWYYSFSTNMIINIYNLYNFTSTSEITKNNIFSFIFPILMVNTLPIIIYFQEQDSRSIFLENLEHQKNLLSFESLINEILPNQIMIMNENNKKLIFCNNTMQKFHKTVNLTEILENVKLNYTENNTEKNLLSILQSLSIKNLKPNQFLNYEIKVKTKEGINYFDTKISEIYWRAQKAYLILFTDISALKDVERLKEVDAYKDQLLATVSHDLRTPLNGMMGIMEITYEKTEDKELKKNIKIAIRCANLLLFMINDILDFSLINNGKLRLDFSRVKIFDLIKEVKSMLKFQCSKKGIELISKIEENAKNIEITTDPRRFQQILLNLLSNAYKFTSQGHIKLDISLSEKEMKFKVEDTGLGIKKEDLPKLFKLFGKLEQNNPSINKSGVGLGLVISKHLLCELRRDNKTFDVSSVYGKGTTFSFGLPLDEEEDQISYEKIKNSEELEEKMNNYKRFRVHVLDLRHIDANSNHTSPNIKFSPLISSHKVLVVDDDQISLFIIGKYLENFELQYKTANNGAQCLEILKKEKGFTILIMDCNMPVLNGFQTAIQIRKMQKNRELENFPILALTANTSKKDIEQCKLAFMDHYLAKPVSKKKMKESLEDILNLKLNLEKKQTIVDKIKNGKLIVNK